MLKESFIQPGSICARTHMPMRPLQQAYMLAVVAAFALSTGAAFAQSSANKENQAQMKVDEAALAFEKILLKSDHKTLKADVGRARLEVNACAVQPKFTWMTRQRSRLVADFGFSPQTQTVAEIG